MPEYYFENEFPADSKVDALLHPHEGDDVNDVVVDDVVDGNVEDEEKESPDVEKAIDEKDFDK